MGNGNDDISSEDHFENSKTNRQYSLEVPNALIISCCCLSHTFNLLYFSWNPLNLLYWNLYLSWNLSPKVNGLSFSWNPCVGVGCPLETNKNKFWFEPKQTETRSVSRLFRFVSWNQKEKILVCFIVSHLYRNNRNKQICFVTNRNKPKQTETTLNFRKNFQIYSLLNCLGGSSVCFGSIKTLCFGIEAKQLKQTVSKQPKKPKKPRKKTKNPTFSVKNNKICSLSNCFGLSPHQNFRYRSETTETNVLFRLVPKLVSVPVLVVSNRN